MHATCQVIYDFLCMHFDIAGFHKDLCIWFVILNSDDILPVVHIHDLLNMQSVMHMHCKS